MMAAGSSAKSRWMTNKLETTPTTRMSPGGSFRPSTLVRWTASWQGASLPGSAAAPLRTGGLCRGSCRGWCVQLSALLALHSPPWGTCTPGGVELEPAGPVLQEVWNQSLQDLYSRRCGTRACRTCTPGGVEPEPAGRWRILTTPTTNCSNCCGLRSHAARTETNSLCRPSGLWTLTSPGHICTHAYDTVHAYDLWQYRHEDIHGLYTPYSIFLHSIFLSYCFHIFYIFVKYFSFLLFFFLL